MNYIQEINAFYTMIETNPLSAGAVSLWHTLMHINNRTYWQETFSVPAVVLRYKSGLTESSFKRARAELRDKGYISFTSRGTKAPIYQIHSLVYDDEPNNSHECVNDEKKAEEAKGQKEKPSNVQDMGEKVSPLYKQDETKRQTNNIHSREFTFGFYRKHFGRLDDDIAANIHQWGNRLGDDLIIEAMKRALDQRQVTWTYVKGILHNWNKANLQTIQDVVAAEAKFRRAQRYAQKEQEVIPDWFIDRKRKQRRQAEKSFS